MPLLRALLRRIRGLGLLHKRDEQQGQQYTADKATRVACVGNIRVEEALNHTNADKQHKEARRVLLLPKKQDHEEGTVEAVHAA